MSTYILRNLNILNGLLLAAVILLIIFIAIPFLSRDIWVSIPKVTRTTVGQGMQTVPAANPSLADFAAISDQNLFNPARKIPAAGAGGKIFTRPEIVLYGTLITGNMKIAFIEDKKAPKVTPGRGRRQIAARKGDNINGYILTQIEPDRILLVKGNDRITVKLEEGEKRKQAKEGDQQTTTPQEGAVPSEIQNKDQMQPPSPEQIPETKAEGR